MAGADGGGFFNVYDTELPFTLERDEVEELQDVDTQLQLLQEERIQLKVRLAYKKGFASKDLKALKTIDGSSFIRIKTNPCYATASNGDKAYLCCDEFSQVVRCGWVKGEPNTSRYAEALLRNNESRHCVLCWKTVKAMIR